MSYLLSTLNLHHGESRDITIVVSSNISKNIGSNSPSNMDPEGIVAFTKSVQKGCIQWRTGMYNYYFSSAFTHISLFPFSLTQFPTIVGQL